jgi:DNA processing protein
MVAAVPGSVHHRSSEGCHALIRDGVADLVTGPQDVLSLHRAIGDRSEASSVRARGTRTEDAPDLDDEVARLTGALAQVYRCLATARARETADVAVRAGIDSAEARSALLDLELRGLTVHTAAGWRRAARRPRGGRV